MTDTELLEMAGTAIRHGVLNVYEGRSDADMQRLVDKMLNDPAAYYTVTPLYPALRVYAELRERVAAKSCGSAIQAVKRLIRTCARNDLVLVGRRYAGRERRVSAGHGNALPGLQRGAVLGGTSSAVLPRRKRRRHPSPGLPAEAPRVGSALERAAQKRRLTPALRRNI